MALYSSVAKPIPSGSVRIWTWHSKTLIPSKTLAEVIQQAIMTRTAFGIA
jgi:hypothetical protein